MRRALLFSFLVLTACGDSGSGTSGGSGRGEQPEVSHADLTSLSGDSLENFLVKATPTLARVAGDRYQMADALDANWSIECKTECFVKRK